MLKKDGFLTGLAYGALHGNSIETGLNLAPFIFPFSTVLRITYLNQAVLTGHKIKDTGAVLKQYFLNNMELTAYGYDIGIVFSVLLS